MSLRRPVTAVTLGFGIALTIPFLASAHNSGASANCSGITTTLQFFENAAGDRVYTYIDDMVNPVDTFNGPFVTTTHTVPVPQDGVAHQWRVFVDSVSGGNGTQYDATYNGNVGPCGEVITTTTVAPTTTTTEAPTTTSTTTTTEAVTTSTSTTTSSVETSSTTSTLPATTSTVVTSTTSATTTLPSTSSSVETTSTTSLPPSTSTVPSATTTPPASTTPPAPSSTTPECSDNPNTPTDDCAPICTPVTLEDGTNSCGPPLPATGSNTAAIVIAAWIAILAGIIALGYGAAHRNR